MKKEKGVQLTKHWKFKVKLFNEENTAITRQNKKDILANARYSTLQHKTRPKIKKPQDLPCHAVEASRYLPIITPLTCDMAITELELCTHFSV